jgi:hypothetical protein
MPSTAPDRSTTYFAWAHEEGVPVPPSARQVQSIALMSGLIFCLTPLAHCLFLKITFPSVPEKLDFRYVPRDAQAAGAKYAGRLFQKAYCGQPSKGLIPGAESGAVSCSRSKWFWNCCSRLMTRFAVFLMHDDSTLCIVPIFQCPSPNLFGEI